MMSRRDSRVHIAVRQNDTLQEFENFKKKFLFANKQITKQNCSLSLKIEELNAHISTLYVENLRLRASEIALQSQLKRQKEKCHRIMADAEMATLNLLKHFSIIRQSYNVPAERPPSPRNSDSSPSPRCQKPPPRSPSAPRLAQLPSVPDIIEDPEPHETSSEENGILPRPERIPALVSTSSRRYQTNISRLPVPSRVSSPPPMSTVNLIEEGPSRKRKLTRRTSGLMAPSDYPTNLSAAFGETAPEQFELSEEEEAVALQALEDIVSREEEREEEEASKKPKKKVKTRDQSDHDIIERRERKKAKDRDGVSAVRLKDVTNSPPRRRRAPSIADLESDDRGCGCSSELPNQHPPQSKNRTSAEEYAAYLPTPLPSSAANTPVAHQSALPSVDAEAGINGRERRSRKSVNYAEPKLNTKMRKPDSIPPPGARPSLPSMTPTSTPAVTPAPIPTSSQGKSSDRSSPEMEDLDATSSKQKSVQGAGTGRRSVSSATVSKRKRVSRSQSDDGTDGHDENETDSADADAEFSDFRSGWANVNTRQKSMQSSDTQNVNGTSGYRRTQQEIEDGVGRRHSMAG